MAEQKKTTNKSNTTSKTSANKNASNRSAANKNTGTKERSTRKTTTAMNQKRFGDSIVDEIIIILVIVVCIVAQLSLVTDSMGVIGGAISSLFKGLFGLGGVLVPISAIVYCIWLLVSKERKGAILRACGVVLFIWTIASFMQVVNPLYGGNLSFINRVAFYFGEGAIANGGLIGASSGGMLVSALGAFGAGLILFAVLIISIIMTTGKSLFYALGDLSARQKVKRKARNERVKIQAEEIRQMELLEEERLARRRENLVRKKNYNIQLRKGEGTKKVMEVQATNFRKKKEPSFQKAKPIFDFVIEEKAEKEVQVAPILKAVKPVTAPVVEPFVKRFAEPIVEQEEPIVVELQKRVKPDFAEDIFADADEAMAEAEFDDIPIILAKDSLPEIEEEAEIAVATEEFDETSETDEAPKAASAPTAKTPLEQVAMALAEPEEKPQEKPYQFPPISLLGVDPKTPTGDSKAEMMANARKLESTLKSFGVEAKVVQINSGPTVTRYELSPSQGVKVSKIVNLADDIALNLAASGIRIEAPIPGKAAVGIEVPNKETKSVYLRTVLESEAFLKHPSKVAFALGEDIAGNAVVTDIAKMPHMLIAGATGSGKSVCINTLITSILYKADPNEVKLLLVDPKVVELSVYNGIPHLLIPVVTDPKKASAALNWAVREMLNRYNDFAASGVRDIKGFNAMKEETGDLKGKMSQIVIVIDELADLMMAAAGEVEDSICRLAQMARAAGMHLIIATQRPSVDVITGVIKANIPSRLAFAVSSGIDSRTILDMVGAEKLLGKGDMLFYPTGQSKPARLQGAFVTDKEVEEIVTFLKKTGRPDYTQETINQITAVQKTAAGTDEDSDEFYEDAVDLIIEKEKASVSMLQRQFRIGYNRAARLVDELERNGVVGPEDGSKPRKVLITRSEWEEMNAPVEEEIP